MRYKHETRQEAKARWYADLKNAKRRRLKDRARAAVGKPATTQSVAESQEAVLRIVRRWFADGVPATPKAANVIRDLPFRVSRMLEEARDEFTELEPKVPSKTKQRAAMRLRKRKIEKIFAQATEQATMTKEKVARLPWPVR